MKIEKAINSQFINSTHKAVVNIFYTNNWIRDKQAEVFASYGLQPQHFNILRILAGKHPQPVSPGEIKEVMIDKGPDVTRLLEKLEKKKLLKREICLSNRRKIDVHITEEGLTLAKTFGEKIKHAMKDIGENLTQEEAEQLSFLLDKMRG